MGHFYYTDPSTGLDEPLYEVPYADPSRGMRPATLRDAKKLRGYPSPNTIMGILAKPAITRWSQNLRDEAWKVAIAEGLAHDCDWDAAIARVNEIHEREREAAANEGTAIHDAIEGDILQMLGRVDIASPRDDVDYGIVDAATLWLKDQPWSILDVEAIFTSPEVGIGGKIDLVATKDDGHPVIVDWKTTTTAGKSFNPYWTDKTPLLAAYAMGYFGGLDVECWNVFLSRDEPGVIFPVKYTENQIEWGFKKFAFCYELWVMENDYDPRKRGGIS